MTRITLVLCAALATLGTGAVGAQGTSAEARPAESAVGTATTVDETTLSIGEAGAGVQADASAVGSTTFSYFLRMIVVLALVVAAIYGVYRLMRRMSRPRAAEDESIRLLASRSLGPGKALHIVGLGTKAYFIGTADSSVSLLAQIDDKEYLDDLFLKAAQNPQKPGSAADFGEMLSRLLGSRKKKGPASGTAGDFLAGQRKRLTRF